MAKISQKKLDTLISAAWGRLAFGVQVDIMDLGKIFRDCKTAYTTNSTLEAIDAAVLVAIETYRKN